MATSLQTPSVTPIQVLLFVVVVSAVEASNFSCTRTLHDRGCDCSMPDRAIICSSGLSNLTTIPTDFPLDVRTLTIRLERLVEVYSTSLTSYDRLTGLHLDADGIRRIDVGALSSLSLLETLTLANNELRFLDAGVFDGLRSLTSLTLSGNPIYWIDAGLFAGPGASRIEILDLSRCRINDVERGAFSDLERLATVNLSSNRIRSLEGSGLIDAPSVRSLYLADNDLARLALPELPGTKVYQLRELVVRRNRISAVERGALAPFGNLEVVDLAFNRLEAVDAADLPWETLTELLVHDNPWNCSGCTNSWLVDEQSAVRQWNLHASVRCNWPPAMSGRYVYAAADSQDVFAGCSPTSSSDDPRRVALFVAGGLILLLVVVVVFLVVVIRCRKLRHRQNRGLIGSGAKSTPGGTGSGASSVAATSVPYHQMVDMSAEPRSTSGRQTYGEEV